MPHSIKFVFVLLLNINLSNSNLINLCCPFGELYTEIRLPSRDRCQTEHQAERGCQPYAGNINDLNEINEVNNAGEEFKCKEGSTLLTAEDLFGPVESVLTDEGLLSLNVQEYNSNNTKQITYNSSNFCLMLTDIPEYDDYDAGGFKEDNETKIIRTAYSVCYQDETMGQYEEEMVFTEFFYPSAIFISDFFILITLCIYLFVKDMRKKLFGKITVGFLINIFFCYTFLGIHYTLDIFLSNDLLLETLPCKLLGYIIQHTFIAFFFWISAMAFNITFALTNVFSARKNQNIFPTICYAQGCPLLVTLITVLMDLYGPCDYILPNVGKYTCFVGSQYDPLRRFFELPEFLYFYVIIAFIILVNIILFTITGASLISHWIQTKHLKSSHNNSTKKHFKIVSKIFVIMGIPWACELASSVVGHIYGDDQSFTVRIALDIMNLLTGVLIFTVLVCKKEVMKGIKEQMTVKTNSSNST